MEKYITLNRLAKKIGLHKTNLFSYIESRNFSIKKMRMPEAHNQFTYVVSKKNANKIIQMRKKEGFARNHKVFDGNQGYFYIIQLSKNRIKLGFTNSIRKRLSEIRSVVPDAKYLKSFSCKRDWERCAIDCISMKCKRKISNEVYESDNTTSVLKKAMQFFSMMPNKIKLKCPESDA